MQIVKKGDESCLSNLRRIASLLLAWVLFCGLLLGVVKVAHRYDDELARLKEEKSAKYYYLCRVTPGYYQQIERLNALYKEGKYEELVDAMEQEYARYERCMAELGGLEEVVR